MQTLNPPLFVRAQGSFPVTDVTLHVPDLHIVGLSISKHFQHAFCLPGFLMLKGSSSTFRMAFV